MPRNKKRKQQPGTDSRTSDASDPVKESEADQAVFSAQIADRELKGEELSPRPNHSTSDPVADGKVMEAVQSNAELLQQVLEQLADLRPDVHTDAPGTLASALLSDTDNDQCERHQRQIAALEDQIAELQQQNSDLAARVASSNLQQSISTPQSSSNDALSWEERKQVIIQQMESDTFDSEEFISSLQRESIDSSVSPSQFVESLSTELASREQELARREEEIHELRCLLDHQSETRDDGVAIGAAAIAEMIDSDQLVEQERQRLQLLQAEWEEKFRQSEIEASLERAKLSRERQQVAKKQAELDEQLEHIRRAERLASDSGKSRKWLVALGLADD